MQQFSVHKIGPEIKIAGLTYLLLMQAYLWLLALCYFTFFIFRNKRKKNYSR